MFGWFISHQWKAAIRSAVWQKNLVINIILGFFILYMIVNLLFLGFFSDVILEQIFPREDVVKIFNSGLLYYLGIDLFIRFYMQDVPVMSIEPYLHLPVPKSKIVNYLLSRSLLAFFNFIPFFIALPFAVKVIGWNIGGTTALIWFIGLYLFVMFNNYLIVYIKRQLLSKPWVALVFGGVLALLILGEYFHLISISAISGKVFGLLLTSKLFVLVPLFLAGFIYYLNYRFLLANTYPEEISTRKAGKAVATGDIRFLHRFGQMGELIALEMKMIWRHKRTRSVLFITLAFAFYGLFFYNNPRYVSDMGRLLLPGILLTGIFLFNYGQFLISWHSSWYDAFLTQNISPYTFVLSRFWIVAPMCILSFLLSIPYVYFGTKVLYINFACLLFNIGFNSKLVMFFGMVSPRRIDLTKRNVMNWQGVNASQFVLVGLVMIVPYVVYLPFYLFHEPYLGIAAVGIFGIINMVFSREWFKMLAKRLEARKYKIAEGFRESE